MLGLIAGVIVLAGFAGYWLKSKSDSKPGNANVSIALPAPDNSKSSNDPLMNGKWVVFDSTDKMGKRSVSLEHIGHVIEGSPKHMDETTFLHISTLSLPKSAGYCLSIILPARANIIAPLISLRFDEGEIIKVSELKLMSLVTSDPSHEWLTADGGDVFAPIAQFNKYAQRLETASKLRLQYSPSSHEGFITVEFDVQGFRDAMVEYKTKVNQKGN